MKQILICSAILIAAVLAGCEGSDKKTGQILEDPQQQDAVFTAILNDKAKLQSFMDRMHRDPQAQESMRDTNMMSAMMKDCPMMKNDTTMMNMMMNCMMNMSKDSSMCRIMCDKMMENENMMNMMMDNMIEACKKDSAMCNMMCGKMMNAPHMKEMMEDMMKE